MYREYLNNFKLLQQRRDSRPYVGFSRIIADMEKPYAAGTGAPTLVIRDSHRAIGEYQQSLAQYSLLHATHEGAVKAAFQTLLETYARKLDWTLVGEYQLKTRKKHQLRIDGALLDQWSLVHGYWEAKDEDDDLDEEIKKKISLGYPTVNTIFQSPTRAVLYQDGRRVLDEAIEDKAALVVVLRAFFGHLPKEIEKWPLAVAEFGEQVPRLAASLIALIHSEREQNKTFGAAFATFAAVCRRAIDADLGDEPIEKMLVQHVLTERLFRVVFDNPDFVRRNVIAAEIEKVVDALVSRSFNRKQFLKRLDPFYLAIERTARSIDSYGEKQGFLNTVYERFFQNYDRKTADTHGIVYTPQPVVGFIVRSVDNILRREFGRSLGDKGVHVVDPFVGTGNFILQVMREIPKTQLQNKYRDELHANEVMLLPYYIASMNIEHEYSERTGEYRPFEGMCFVDTFELYDTAQKELFTEQNTRRVEKQKKAPIFVVVGNPPYNAWQEDENDDNRNKKHKHIDKRVADTYAQGSSATLLTSLGDPYVKALRWASDRIGDEGVVAMITNNRFVHGNATDGMRRELAADFDSIYHLDLKGDARTTGNERKRQGGNVFLDAVRVGVGISIFVRKRARRTGKATVHLHRVDDELPAPRKLRLLDQAGSIDGVQWVRVVPDERHTWVTDGLKAEFQSFMPLVASDGTGVFLSRSNGLKSNSDAYIYDFSVDVLAERARKMVNAYNSELRLRNGDRGRRQPDIERSKLKWVRKTKRCLERGLEARFSENNIVPALYRPFTKKWAFFDRMFNEDVYRLPELFGPGIEQLALIVTTHAQIDFSCQVTNCLPCMDVGGRPSFVVPLHVRVEGGGTRSNVSPTALAIFRSHYSDESIQERDIFNYVYAILNHSEYRGQYEKDLKRDFPRIPLVGDFWPFAFAGRELTELHLGYESAREYPLRRIEKSGARLDWRVNKARLNGDEIVYNEFLTLAGVPQEALQYRIGNRSAIEWFLEQHRVSVEKRSGIRSDPNREDVPDHLLRLIGKVVQVSVETVRITTSLPSISARAPGLRKAVKTERMAPIKTRPTASAGGHPEQSTKRRRASS